MNKHSKLLIYEYCGNVGGLMLYLIPLIKELSLTDKQINAFFRTAQAKKANLWTKISQYIKKNKIKNRKEGVRQFIITTLKKARCPVE